MCSTTNQKHIQKVTKHNHSRNPHIERRDGRWWKVQDAWGRLGKDNRCFLVLFFAAIYINK